jgi:hypothetical protein
MTFKRILLALSFISFYDVLPYAQNAFVFNGRVTDQTDHHPLPYTTVHLKKSPVGVTSNEEGNFELHLNDNCKNDTLVASYIGYETLKIPVSSLNLLRGDLELIKTPVSLHEVIIGPSLSADQILDKVFEHQSLNYNMKSFCLDGFFRTYVRSGANYDRLIEGDVSLVSDGFNKRTNQWRKELVYLNEVRTSLITSLAREPNDGKANNLDEILHINEILLSSFYDKNIFHFAASIEQTEYLDTTKIITLKLYAKDVNSFKETTALLKIDASNWAVIQIKFEWHIYEKQNNQIIRSSIDGVSLRELSDNFTITYKNYNGKYYLNFFKRNYLKEQITSAGTHELEIRTEFATNQIETDAKVPNYSLKLDRGKGLYIQTCNLVYHPDFWKNYNAYLNSPEVESVFENLNRKGNLQDQFNNSRKNSTKNK